MALPQLDAELFITDGGLETSLVFQAGIDLPDFAAFPLLDSDGRDHVSAGLGEGCGLAGVTMTYIDEAVGLVQAARANGVPVAVSFTVETDGRLPSGETLSDAIDRVDEATSGYVAYFMVNCAHPSHFESVLERGGPWLVRVKAIRANASKASHAELDEAEDLDRGDPVELATDYRALRRLLPDLRVVGGCCGTDIEHVASITEALLTS
jgi:S-methylmethionine-dependent homocysteine/selenocysteine methylase